MVAEQVIAYFRKLKARFNWAAPISHVAGQHATHQTADVWFANFFLG